MKIWNKYNPLSIIKIWIWRIQIELNSKDVVMWQFECFQKVHFKSPLTYVATVFYKPESSHFLISIPKIWSVFFSYTFIELYF